MTRYSVEDDDAPEKAPGLDIKTHVAAMATVAVTERSETYGKPKKNFERIAAFWQLYLRLRDAAQPGPTWNISSADVAAMMRLVKEARLIESPGHLDSFIDIVGYALCGAEVAGVTPELIDIPFGAEGAKPRAPGGGLEATDISASHL